MRENTPELIERAKKGDKEARAEIISDNLALVHSVVKKFLNRGHEAEDLFQIGCIGIIKAIDKFDLSYNVRFSTYAVPMIMGEIKRFLRDDGMIKVSRGLKEISAKALSVKESLENEYGRAVSISEIAEKMGKSVESVVMALESSYPHESIYKTINDGEKNEILLVDKLADETESADKTVNSIALGELICKLNERDKKILIWRYFKGKTQREISDALKISQVQVSRIEKKILADFKNKLKGA